MWRLMIVAAFLVGGVVDGGDEGWDKVKFGMTPDQIIAKYPGEEITKGGNRLIIPHPTGGVRFAVCEFNDSNQCFSVLVILTTDDLEAILKRLADKYMSVCGCGQISMFDDVNKPKPPHEVHEFCSYSKKPTRKIIGESMYQTTEIIRGPLWIYARVLTLATILDLKWQGTPMAAYEKAVLLRYVNKPTWNAETNKPPL